MPETANRPRSAESALLRQAVETLRGDLIGGNLWNKYRKWPMFSKFFDNLGPLPHHIHHRQAHAERVGADGKPEMYFFRRSSTITAESSIIPFSV